MHLGDNDDHSQLPSFKRLSAWCLDAQVQVLWSGGLDHSTLVEALGTQVVVALRNMNLDSAALFSVCKQKI